MQRQIRLSTDKAGEAAVLSQYTAIVRASALDAVIEVSQAAKDRYKKLKSAEAEVIWFCCFIPKKLFRSLTVVL